MTAVASSPTSQQLRLVQAKPQLPPRLRLEAATYTSDKLVLVLLVLDNRHKPTRESVRVEFLGLDSFRISEEGVMINTMHRIAPLNLTKSNFMELYNSQYLMWACEERGESRLSEGWRHFIIYTSNEVIEVLGKSEPSVTVGPFHNE